jgi:hypothetical protein
MSAGEPEGGAARPGRLAVLAAAVTIVAAGVLLRLYHLNGPSLWWDENVEVAFASLPSPWQVLRAVKLGIPPGSANAGAVPLDYLLLHLHLALVPRPAPHWLELYYRFPSFLWSGLTLVAVFAYCRRFLDRGVALVATLVLASSIVHVLYAVEVRFYSLAALATVANLYAFSRVVLERRSLSAWGLFAAVNVLYFLSALFALLLVGSEHLILAGLLVRDRWRAGVAAGEAPRPLALAPLLASGLVIALSVALYFLGTSLGAPHGRPGAGALDPWRETAGAVAFFTLGNRTLSYVFLGALPLALLYAARRPGLLPIALHLVLGFGAIPVLILVERWKQYYFHPRHALFLLPHFAIVVALGLLTALRLLDPFRAVVRDPRRRAALNVLGAMGLVLGTQMPVVGAYLRHPDPFFTPTKHLRDFKSLARDLDARVASLAPGEGFVLIAERDSVANAAASVYLRAWGLGSRVVFRATRDVPATLAGLARLCPGGHGTVPGPELERALPLTVAVGLTPAFRDLLGLQLPIGTWPRRVVGCAVAVYSPAPPAARTLGFVARRYAGFTLLEPAPARPTSPLQQRAPP